MLALAHWLKLKPKIKINQNQSKDFDSSENSRHFISEANGPTLSQGGGAGGVDGGQVINKNLNKNKNKAIKMEFNAPSEHQHEQLGVHTDKVRTLLDRWGLHQVTDMGISARTGRR